MKCGVRIVIYITHSYIRIFFFKCKLLIKEIQDLTGVDKLVFILISVLLIYFYKIFMLFFLFYNALFFISFLYYFFIKKSVSLNWRFKPLLLFTLQLKKMLFLINSKTSFRVLIPFYVISFSLRLILGVNIWLFAMLLKVYPRSIKYKLFTSFFSLNSFWVHYLQQHESFICGTEIEFIFGTLFRYFIWFDKFLLVVEKKKLVFILKCEDVDIVNTIIRSFLKQDFLRYYNLIKLDKIFYVLEIYLINYNSFKWNLLVEAKNLKEKDIKYVFIYHLQVKKQIRKLCKNSNIIDYYNNWNLEIFSISTPLDDSSYDYWVLNVRIQHFKDSIIVSSNVCDLILIYQIVMNKSCTEEGIEATAVKMYFNDENYLLYNNSILLIDLINTFSSKEGRIHFIILFDTNELKFNHLDFAYDKIYYKTVYQL